jgi:serine/threonine-protein kinase
MEPEWERLPSITPAPIRRLLRRCLDKDRNRRLADAADARLEIEEALAPPSALDNASPLAIASRPRAVALASAALLVGLAIATAATWALMRPAPAKRQPMRFAIVPTAAQPVAIAGFDRDFALSPDGTHLVYVSLGGQIMVRAIDQIEAVQLGGITGARSPFFSPDGRWVGFFSGGADAGELKKVSIAGGPPFSLCRYSGAPRGASWGDDKIVFATAGRNGLLRVSAAGGEPTVVTTIDAASGQANQFFPSILPGGRAILFTIAGGTTDTNQVAVLDLASGQRTILVRGGSQAEYVEPGYLVYAVAGALRAVRFNPATRTIGSDPVPVVEQVRTLPTGAAEFSVSRQGTLVYVPGSATAARRSLVWVTRQGQETAITAPPRAYVFPRLSPDGTRVALDIRDQDHDIWIADLARQTLTRLTDAPASDIYPVWTPDGQRIIFASARAGKLNVFWQAADNTGPVERLTTSPNPHFPISIAPDGTRLIVDESVPPASGRELRVLRMPRRPETDTLSPPVDLRRTEPLMRTKFNGMNGEVSPDGHWLAYQSNDSGRNEIFVRPFPNVDDGHWTISTNGGTRPVWERSGKELFYLDGTNALTAVSVRTTPIFSFDTPTKLLEGRYYANEDGRSYDVSPDGQRFLMIKGIASGDPGATPASMIIVVNWIEELMRLVPMK